MFAISKHSCSREVFISVAIKTIMPQYFKELSALLTMYLHTLGTSINMPLSIFR
nr:MAG TPA: hypothetical protein [Caudoviricetes sp.]